jgi:retinol dehydrogenase-12
MSSPAAAGSSGSGAMAGRVCLVTGANGGMGRVIATELARQGAQVTVVCRTAQSGEEVRRHVVGSTGADVEVLVADLSRQGEVRGLAEQFTARHDTLHVLVNNAGAHFRERLVSHDGIEMHLAVDHLAGFLLTNLLRPLLEAGAPSRVVNIVSDTISDTRQIKIRRRPRPATLDFANLQSESSFTPMIAYGQAKLATLMCGYVLADQLEGSGVTVNAVHPGIVDTGIVSAVAPKAAAPFLGVVRRFLLTPEQGAQAALRLATAPELATVTGRYFVRQTQHRSPPISYDVAKQQQIWQVSHDLTSASVRCDP